MIHKSYTLELKGSKTLKLVIQNTHFSRSAHSVHNVGWLPTHRVCVAVCITVQCVSDRLSSCVAFDFAV